MITLISGGLLILIPVKILKVIVVLAPHGSTAVTLTVYSLFSSGVPVNLLNDWSNESQLGRTEVDKVKESPFASTNVSEARVKLNCLFKSIYISVTYF